MSRLDEFLRPATSTQMTAHDAAASIANLVAMGVRGACGVVMALPLSQQRSHDNHRSEEYRQKYKRSDEKSQDA